MKVAFLTMGRDIGGAKQDVLTLSRQIAAKGHEVYVLAAPGVMDRELEGSAVKFFPAEFDTRNPIGLWKASRVLRRFVREKGIELVNPQGFFTAAIAFLMQFGLPWLRLPVVTTIHMFSSLDFYKYARLLNLFSYRIITESNCERVRLEGGGARRDRITVINNSVDMTRFSPETTRPVLRETFGISPDETVFGIVARLSPEKRHQDFIAAARLVHTQNPATRFLIVGDGPTLPDIAPLATGTEGYLHFCGMRRDIPDCLRSLDVFVLCSEVESLPLSIREAMSMALPVVVTDVGGNREIVAEGVTGLLVPALDPQALAAAMLRLAADRTSREKMGAEARRFCADRFDARSWARLTEEKFKHDIDTYHKH